jgi:hypothetical protein
MNSHWSKLDGKCVIFTHIECLKILRCNFWGYDCPRIKLHASGIASCKKQLIHIIKYYIAESYIVFESQLFIKRELIFCLIMGQCTLIIGIFCRKGGQFVPDLWLAFAMLLRKHEQDIILVCCSSNSVACRNHGSHPCGDGKTNPRWLPG